MEPFGGPIETRTSTGSRNAVSRTRTSTRSCLTRSWEARRARATSLKGCDCPSDPSAYAGHRHGAGLMSPRAWPLHRARGGHAHGSGRAARVNGARADGRWTMRSRGTRARRR
jgi:hypothetical protein